MACYILCFYSCPHYITLFIFPVWGLNTVSSQPFPPSFLLLIWNIKYVIYVGEWESVLKCSGGSGYLASRCGACGLIVSYCYIDSGPFCTAKWHQVWWAVTQEEHVNQKTGYFTWHIYLGLFILENCIEQRYSTLSIGLCKNIQWWTTITDKYTNVHGLISGANFWPDRFYCHWGIERSINFLIIPPNISYSWILF